MTGSQPPPPDSVPRLALLGIAERTIQVRHGHPITWFRNILGLRSAFFSFVYPMPAVGWHILLAWYSPTSDSPAAVRILDPSGKQLIRIDLGVAHRGADESGGDAVEQREWQLVPYTTAFWFLVDLPLDELVVEAPASLSVLYHDAKSARDTPIGTIEAVELKAEPLTEDRIAAIKANPRATKSVRLALGCKHCESKYTVIAEVDRNPRTLEQHSAHWYTEVPDEWTCDCRQTTLSLLSIRRNMHGLLGLHVPSGDTSAQVRFIRMYEKGTVFDLVGHLVALLDTNPPEEPVQQFLASNTLFLHRFGPKRLRPKAKLSTHHTTDFALLDSRNVLVLIELERPSLRLLKKNGDIAQDLQHAFDQVDRWLHYAQRRWTGAIEALGFADAEVAGIRGVVIAGRNGTYPQDQLMRLKGQLHGNTEFYTYDDLVETTQALAQTLDEVPDWEAV